MLSNNTPWLRLLQFYWCLSTVWCGSSWEWLPTRCFQGGTRAALTPAGCVLVWRVVAGGGGRHAFPPASSGFELRNLPGPTPLLCLTSDLCRVIIVYWAILLLLGCTVQCWGRGGGSERLLIPEFAPPLLITWPELGDPPWGQQSKNMCRSEPLQGHVTPLRPHQWTLSHFPFFSKHLLSVTTNRRAVSRNVCRRKFWFRHRAGWVLGAPPCCHKRRDATDKRQVSLFSPPLDWKFCLSHRKFCKTSRNHTQNDSNERPAAGELAAAAILNQDAGIKNI